MQASSQVATTGVAFLIQGWHWHCKMQFLKVNGSVFFCQRAVVFHRVGLGFKLETSKVQVCLVKLKYRRNEF